MNSLSPADKEKIINKVKGKGTAEMRRLMKERENARNQILLQKHEEKKQKLQTARENTEEKGRTDNDNN